MQTPGTWRILKGDKAQNCHPVRQALDVFRLLRDFDGGLGGG